MLRNSACREVAKEVYCKYYHDTVYCISFEAIVKRLEKLVALFWEGKKRINQKGKENSKAAKEYKDLIAKKETLFDVSTDDNKRKEKCEEEWGIKMGELEKIYLADQRGERKMECCNKAPDLVWYRAIMVAERLRVRQDEDYVRQRNKDFRGKSLDQINVLLREQGVISSSSPQSSTVRTPVK